MFERFTDRARSVVVLAQEEARLLNHNYIGTEHLLLGLLHEGKGVAAQALIRLGISLDDVRALVEEIIGRGGAAAHGHVPFTPRAKKVLELSLREALGLGHNYIGTEHILLGLIREGEGVAARVLDRMGADLSLVRQEVIVLLSAMGPLPAAPVAGPLGALGALGPLRPPARTQTPGNAQAMDRAQQLAGDAPVGTHDVLRAIVADPNSLGAKALATFGVTAETLKATLAELDRSGTTDELPEESGARRTSVEIAGDRIAVVIEDEGLRARLAEVLGRDALRSGEPGSAGFAYLWQDVHRHLLTIFQHLERSAAQPGRPPELDSGWEVAAYAATQRPGGASSLFETADGVDAAEVRAGMAAWLAANQPRNVSGVSYLVVLVGGSPAGGRTYQLSWGAVAGAPVTELQFLVAHALVDLGAAEPGDPAAEASPGE